MRKKRHARAGFTLVEMLIVITIITVVAVVTAVSMAAVGRRSSREGAAEDVMSVLRQARLSAVDGGRGALVRIDRVERAIYGLSSAIEAAWHFEQLDAATGTTAGAKSLHGALLGTTGIPQIASDGAVGLCMQFNYDGAAYDPTMQQYVDCGNYPVYNQTDGIRLEAYVCPAGPDVASWPPFPVLLGVMANMDQPARLGYSLGLATVPGRPGQYTVHGGFFIDDSALPDGIHLASYYYDTATSTEEGMTLAGSRWHHVAMEFDGYEARLFVNGVLVDLDSYRASENTGADRNPVWDPVEHTDNTFSTPVRIKPARTSNLEIGRAYYPFPPPPAYRYFQGRIDEPRLLSVASGERVNLPARVPIVASDDVIHFDKAGHLDIAYHSGPVYIGLGDPYQIVQLADDIDDVVTTLTVQPNNPYQVSGGIIVVGTDAIGWELMRYTAVSGLQVTGLDRSGQFGTMARSHLVANNEQVLFARVIEVDQMGGVRRVR
ncbi:MAG: prepilin-type N-terminal cleavage/methylation domain-containing protein [Candidatus Brocadiae bacterium]|nr:prepilin-type N-terminal cleavage/methylation domain-containing protein [Candidatus Brocadiia bacterium]